MVITYFGKECFKITLGDLTIALNPVSKSSKALAKTPRFGADIVLSTTNHPDYNGVEQMSFGEREPFVIDGPGDYEIKGLFFKGALSKIVIGGKEYVNTVYGFELDGIKIAFLGALADESTLTAEAKQIASSADLIFVPAGGGEVFDPAAAYKLAVSFDPNIIVPMDADTEHLKRFLKEGGQEKNETLDKLTLKRRDLDGKEAYIAVLEPQS
ncbi:MAG TPA: MBL fold metallo-hydrolase [Candidatus Paceibacterota bacterium]|nr:MBL fold metallo-hydrolase [Candidatus Paceibacterota bacterium]